MLGELIHKKLQENLFSLKLTFLYCNTFLRNFKSAQSIYHRHPKEMYLIHRTWRLCFHYIWDTFLVSWEHHVPSPVIVFFFNIKCFGSSNRLRVLKIFFSNFSPLFTLSWDFFTDLLHVWILDSICFTNSVIAIQFCCCLPAKHSICDVIISVLFLYHRPVLVHWWVVRSFVMSNIFPFAQNC